MDETRTDPTGPEGAADAHASAVLSEVEQAARRSAERPAWTQIGQPVAESMHALFSAGIYAVFIITFIAQVARVDGWSMSPTLDDHDRLIVNKFVYLFNDPQPGDIVMLRYPADPDTMFVKRVIARENDTVHIDDGVVYVNGVAVHDDYVPAEFRSHDMLEPTTLDAGYYFVLGDHRNASSDSRTWGPVPKKYIVGRVNFRWWPLSGARLF